LIEYHSIWEKIPANAHKSLAEKKEGMGERGLLHCTDSRQKVAILGRGVRFGNGQKRQLLCGVGYIKPLFSLPLDIFIFLSEFAMKGA
jgi:hypothetical protein